MNLYFKEALRLDAHARAARIADVNAGFAGGKDATKLVKQLLDQ